MWCIKWPQTKNPVKNRYTRGLSKFYRISTKALDNFITFCVAPTSLFANFIYANVERNSFWLTFWSINVKKCFSKNFKNLSVIDINRYLKLEALSNRYKRVQFYVTIDERKIDEKYSASADDSANVSSWKRRKLLLKDGRRGKGHKTREMTARTSFTSFPEVSPARHAMSERNGMGRRGTGSRFRSLTPYVAVVNPSLFMRSSSGACLAVGRRGCDNVTWLLHRALCVTTTLIFSYATADKCYF